MLLSATTEMHWRRPGKRPYDMATESVDFLAKMGIKGLDVSFCACIYKGDARETIVDGDNWKEKLDVLIDSCRKNDMKITSTHLPYSINYLMYEEEDYAENYAMMVRTLQASEYIGSPWAVVHFRGEGVSDTFFKQLMEDAGVKHTGLALETTPRYSLESLIAVHDRLKEQGYPVGICFDSGHCNIKREHYQYEMLQAMEMLGERIKVLHLHDNRGDRDAHQMPYEGNIPWEDAMRMLKKIGYRGAFNYEISNSHVPEWLREDQARYYVKIARNLISVFENA
ncbi:MAG: sugar phosphate isomerase/epimerase [Clostridiales bacterium]|nr:sugar phosphate isomerase/epimerase [Clostridiales bacterium]